MEQKVGILWGCYARLNDIPEKTAQLMARSGCRLIFVGFETPNPNGQKLIRKVIDRKKTVAKVAYFNSLGIRFIGSFIAGLPGEIEEELDNTLSFALECSVGLTMEQLNHRVRRKKPRELPSAAVNFCKIHPLGCMPGTDFDKLMQHSVRFTEYSIMDNSYNTHIFALDDLLRKNWRIISNHFITFLSEEEVLFFYPVLRLLQLVIIQPYYFAWILTSRNLSPLQLICDLIKQLGRDYVLRAGMSEFHARFSKLLNSYLGISVPWRIGRIVNDY